MPNKKPVDYKQSDKRWGAVPYNGPGGSGATIESSGCGPTSAVMVVATVADKNQTPVEACAWSRANGHRIANAGTCYSFFRPYLAQYGIECRQLFTRRLNNEPDNPVHEDVKRLLGEGYYIIALMGTKANGSRGTWTTGGHYVLVWDFQDGKYLINDPIHKTGNNKYTYGDMRTFQDELKMAWSVDVRAYNREGGLSFLSDKDKFRKMWLDMRKDLQDNDSSEWSEDARRWAVETGIVQGGAPLPNGEPNFLWEDILTREQMATMLFRFAQKIGAA